MTDSTAGAKIFEAKISNVNYASSISIFDSSAPIMFTFDNMGSAGPFAQRNGWGHEFLAKQRINVVSFMEGRQTRWYRHESFVDIVEKAYRLSNADAFPARIAYGGSMGGYAAAAFAPLLNIDRALFISPISSLSRNIVPWETRWPMAQKQDWESAYNDAAVGASKIKDVSIIVDSIFSLDMRHAMRLVDANAATRVFRLPGVGHRLPDHMQALNMLKFAVMGVYSGEGTDPLRFRQLARKRRDYDGYYSWMLSENSPRRTPLRTQIIEKYAGMHRSR